MITIAELTNDIRRRLRDTKKPYRFEDTELLDSLNQVYNDLNYQFKLNVSKFEKQINFKDNIITLPKMVLSFEKAFLNGKALNLKAFDENSKELIISAFSNFQTFAVLPTNKAEGKLEIFVNLSVWVENESVLNNADFLKMALVYGALALLFQIESNENNLQRVGFYENLYKKECDRLRAVISSIYEKKSFLSPCVLI